MEVKSDAEVQLVFENYPDRVQSKMVKLRELVLKVARELEQVKLLEETLKWGEPSYLCKHGSTLRMDWKPKNPDQYAMYFKCTSMLVPTFKKFFEDVFSFEGNRAIVFKISDKIPEQQLEECIRVTLTYHHVKRLPDLGLGAL